MVFKAIFMCFPIISNKEPLDTIGSADSYLYFWKSLEIPICIIQGEIRKNALIGIKVLNVCIFVICMFVYLSISKDLAKI